MQANSGPNSNGCQFFFTAVGLCGCPSPCDVSAALLAEWSSKLQCRACNEAKVTYAVSLQAKTDWLDNKHVVFGRILGDGLLVMRKMENVMTGQNNKPKLQVVISRVWRDVGRVLFN